MFNPQDFLHNINENLAAACRVMQRFFSPVNLAMETQRMFFLGIAWDTVALVLYRRLHMNFETGSLCEAKRLGVLFCLTLLS
jgi:hypothetical protein